MAVSAFYNDRHREGSDVQCNAHLPHPLSEVVAKTAFRLSQTASLSALYHARGVLSKNAALGVRERATGGSFLIIYKVGGKRREGQAPPLQIAGKPFVSG